MRSDWLGNNGSAPDEPRIATASASTRGPAWRDRFRVTIVSYVLGSTILVSNALADTAVCFAPVQPCAQWLIQSIDQATSHIDMFAYTFTDREIGQALIRAQKRSVPVRIIFDPVKYKESIGAWLAKGGIEIVLDRSAGESHAKIMIIDDRLVFAGSYNFSVAAKRNAEDLLRVSDASVVRQFRDFFADRYRAAK
jgi:phosphatidylserine/phosphatidylglycerophosphate/cardiolipin synthase-like enzyme